jgi:hypothetical protein
LNQFHFVKVLELLFIPLNILPVFSSVLNYGVCWTTLLSFFLQVWPAVLLCQRTPTYYGRIVVKILYTPTPIKKNCAVFKNGCIHQCVQRCVYMYIVRTRFYTNFYIVSKRKHNDQFSLKGLKKNVCFRFNKNCKNVHLKIGIQSRHTKALFG